MKNLKARIQKGEALHGCWLNLGSALTAEIVGQSGFDWVLIDLEHGAGNEKDVLAQLQALEHTPAAAIIRVESSAGQRIQRVLDMGAEGIMCPRISTAEEAQKVAKSIHYPPLGNRGVAKMVRASRFAQNFDNYYKEASDTIIGILQIETKEVLHHLDEVAAMEGIDVLFIGPADLTMELGIFGQFDHPLYIKAISDTVLAAQKANKAVGILFFNIEEYKKYHDLGIRFLACGSDSVFVADSARTLSKKLDSFRITNK